VKPTPVVRPIMSTARRVSGAHAGVTARRVSARGTVVTRCAALDSWGGRRRAAPPAALLLLVLAALGLALSACGGGASGARATVSSNWAPKPDKAGGLTRVAFTSGERLFLHTAGGVVDFVPGVNLGSTIPGFSPGELAIRRADYRRWFPQMAALGLRAVRVYTILMPCFYEELAAYNSAHPQAPLYLIQGVWIPEARYLATQDLFDPEVHDGFVAETGDAVAAVHGDLQRPHRPGIAWGRWTADVSPWLYAYSIGVEWDPLATRASDQKNAGRPPYQGRFFRSLTGASPTEVWLAEMLDHTAADEAARGRTMPLTFTNWPTTDPLRHPDEPLAREDIVGIDANHIKASAAWPGGFFASYHAYPYYPDFQRHEPGLAKVRYKGRSDPYAGYLAALRTHHQGMPVMITEFGVPSSMGLAHYGPLDRDQGDHSEQGSMRTDAELLRMIHDLGFAGGFVFEWADEWFKFTWNTIDYELPAERRQLWVNPWTNEEHFGLLAMEPGRRPVVTVDGDGREWHDNRSQVIYEGRRRLREVRAVKDEGYLYLRLVLDDNAVWRRQPLTIGIDVLPGGNGGLPGMPGRDSGADYAVVIGPGEKGQVYVAASNDQYVLLYGRGRQYFAYDPEAILPGSGVWDRETLITNRPLTVPSTGEELPVESFDAGALRYGTSDPADPAFDCRVTWSSGDCVEIRLPYEAIGFADPSSLQALRVGADGRLTTVTVPRVGIGVAVAGRLYPTRGYAWEPWQRVRWHERLKAGADGYAEAVRDALSR